ncbi:MAG: tRNA uridine-5-carboxymethylaminomethyl(34) synthesis GTPase MnmE [Methyloceanibacter sp.]|nr:tRNA uridine-5-carboxymethylaminomethyl(34) synthesis GTPase MnmE [Methyloceanibacter sp.]
MDRTIGVPQPDTILALASGPGLAAIAVIRVSGPRTRDALEAFCGGVPPPRHAALRDIGPPRASKLDRGLVLFFSAPASFTGEDMAELQLHGSRAVTRAVIDALLTLPGIRLAEPGAFARRAFENGKLDLTEVEGLADLIAAETEAQRGQALAQSEGSLRRLYEGWRADLLGAQALMEAGLDFADEADVATDVSVKAGAIVAVLLDSIARHLADNRGERLRDGVRIVIAGPPNAGKSSLLNALAKRDVAIVSEEAGTTRDVIEVHLDLAGIPVILTDTAGIREAQGKVEEAGIERALARVEDADLVLWLVDATAPAWSAPLDVRGTTVGQVWTTGGQVCVLNKIDLATVASGPDRIEISAKTGAGVDRLIAALAARAAQLAEIGTGSPLMTRARHRTELESAQAALDRFGDSSLSPELKAEELRIAARHLGRLTGHIDVEEVLGAIFAEFCIGK